MEKLVVCRSPAGQVLSQLETKLKLSVIQVKNLCQKNFSLEKRALQQQKI